jgi:ribose transport system substrate-binding protein
MIKKWSMAAVVSSIALVLSACAGTASSPTAPAPTPEDTTTGETQSLTIGFAQATQQSPFYVALGDGVRAAAEAAGATLIYVDANGDIEKQNNDIEDLITQGVDALLINPVDPQGIAPSMASAEAAGIPVITVDRFAEGAIAHIGRDNVAMGRLVGDAVLAELGSEGGKILEIQGDAGGTVAMDRSAGFNAAFEGVDSVTVVQGPYAEYIRANAVTAMQDLLQAHPDVRAVYAHNDDMALGALQVLLENGRTDVLVSGFDGLMEAVEAIANGDQYVATSLNDPISLGAIAARTAIAAANGEAVDAYIDAGSGLVDGGNASSFLGATLFAEAK